jgi:hypothetical protein
MPLYRRSDREAPGRIKKTNAEFEARLWQAQTEWPNPPNPLQIQ